MKVEPDGYYTFEWDNKVGLVYLLPVEREIREKTRLIGAAIEGWFEKIGENKFKKSTWEQMDVEKGVTYSIRIRIYENAPSTEFKSREDVLTERLHGAGKLMVENNFTWAYEEGKEIY